MVVPEAAAAVACLPVTGIVLAIVDSLRKSKAKRSNSSSSKQSCTCFPCSGVRSQRNAPADGVDLGKYGENVFKGKVAEPYLKKVGLKSSDLETGCWIHSTEKSDKMAHAILLWGTDRGASSFCHWFQPLASTFRHGDVGLVQNAMWEFGKDGQPKWDFKGKHLLRGETDGSSYPNGGLRETYRAGGYLTIDPESPIFLRGDAIFAPACFVSFDGKSLDEKTPLKRAAQSLSMNGTRLFRLLGVNLISIIKNIGLEQEFFLVPRDKYYKRPDLQMVGRTVMGRLPARGQELCDHYMAPINMEGPALRCMQEMQHECYKLGIPLRTRHREVAPGQYEFAPMFGTVCEHTDENLKIMQILEEVAMKHGLAAVMAEKPFQGVNGSGKHNNWSISAVVNGQQTNLFNPDDLSKLAGRPELFPIVMAALVSAVDKFSDLMRASIACPGNDFRLGAMEAPPSVISTYLGRSITEYLQAFCDGEVKSYNPKTKEIDLGVSSLPKITAPAEDRNRTSPFPFGGHRFEFRACGSSQNVSFVNTVLAAMMAQQFREITERVQAGWHPVEVAKDLLRRHFKCVFNGNGYDKSWPDKAESQGLCRIDSGIEAITRLTERKNIDLFVNAGIFTEDEVQARQTVLLELYVGVVEMECQVMIDMINQHVLPSMKAAGLLEYIAKLEPAVVQLSDCLGNLHRINDDVAKARSARQMRLETMADVRVICDEAEARCPANLWTLATYKEMFFLDLNENINRVDAPRK